MAVYDGDETWGVWASKLSHQARLISWQEEGGVGYSSICEVLPAKDMHNGYI